MLPIADRDIPGGERRRRVLQLDDHPRPAAREPEDPAIAVDDPRVGADDGTPRRDGPTDDEAESWSPAP